VKPSGSRGVLDASAVLALLKQEPGSEQVAQVVDDGAAISAVNLSEVVAKLGEADRTEAAIRGVINALDLDVVSFDAELAYRAGLLRSATRAAGLSLGDRACLALAEHLGLPAFTTDRSWASLRLGATVRVIR
jgi:ribonuclease VapC